MRAPSVVLFAALAAGAPAGCARPAASVTPVTSAASTAAAPARAARAVPLDALVRARLDSLDAQTTVYARHLASGRELAIRADEPMNTASIIKVPIMVLAYRDAEAGRLDRDERYTIRAEDLRRGTGLLQTFAVGLQPTLRDLVTQMIVTSDNTATDIVIGKVGLARVNRMLDSLGYRETRLRMTVGRAFRAVWESADPKHASLTDREVFERGFPSDSGEAARTALFVADSSKWLGRSTAREMSRLLAQLQNGELAGRQSTDEMLRTLRRQLYFSRLPQRIRFRAAVGHKTGDWPPLLGADAGIIYSAAGPIVVSVFTNRNRGSFFDLEATIGRIAEDVLDAWGRTP
jgi:beta-lactamase class A